MTFILRVVRHWIGLGIYVSWCMLACADKKLSSEHHDETAWIEDDTFDHHGGEFSPKSKIHMGFLQRQGMKLQLHQQDVRLFGTNRYELAGGPASKFCTHIGGGLSYEQYMTDYLQWAAQAGSNVVRIWAFQSYAGPSGKDFSHLDKVVAQAKALGLYVILVLENNWQDCTYPTQQPKSREWFASGYRQPYGYPLSLTDYVQAIVQHYRDEPAIAMWQIINEGKLYEDPATLRAFLHDVAQLIRSIDSQHLISSGAAIQCWQGLVGARDFQAYHDSPAIDVLDAHDYGDDQLAWPTCMAQAMDAARQLNKPLLIGEAGINRDTIPPAQRAEWLRQKIEAALAQQAAGYLVWHLQMDPLYHDGYDILPGDPAIAMMAEIGQKLRLPQEEIAELPKMSCTAKLTVDSVWQQGGLTAAAFRLALSNSSSTLLSPPWAVELTVPEGVALLSPWNFQVVEQQGSKFRGMVQASWAHLQPNGGNQIHVGAIVHVTGSKPQFSQIAIQGQTCQVVAD